MPKSKLTKVGRLQEGVVYATKNGIYFVYKGSVCEYHKVPRWQFWRSSHWKKVN